VVAACGCAHLSSAHLNRYTNEFDFR